MTSAICIPLGAIADQAVGGKAEGLARLLRCGFDVPTGFVIVGASSESLPEDLDAHYQRIGAGKVAVRSSASGEDSSEASFAGQYEVAVARRMVIDYQMPLHFPQVFTQRPESVKLEHVTRDDGALVGKPVSRGVATGRARVVETLQEAAALEAGEILIAPITDVGWTPYFSLIAGLATDVGSAVSHGAVMAREYGLPAVVNLRVATSRFRTGDKVVLDGDGGTLALAEPD